MNKIQSFAAFLILFMTGFSPFIRASVDEHGIWYGEESAKGHFVDYYLADALAEFFLNEQAKDVVDLGCGLGDYVKILRFYGIDCDGYDGNPDTFKLTGGVAEVADLCQPLNLNKRYDWVLCLEVAHLLPGKFEKAFFANLDKLNTKGIVLSWAAEGQGGAGHINEHNKDYVKHVMSHYGYIHDYAAELELKKQAAFWWFKNTLMVFRKEKVEPMKVIDVISFFSLDEKGNMPEGYEYRYKYMKDVQSHYPLHPSELEKVVVVNYVLDRDLPLFSKIPKEKLIFFQWEPTPIDLSYFDLFSKVYTWDDTLVDNIKFFKFNYPYLMPMLPNLPSFEEKKFCTLIASNWTQARINIINFFDSKSKGEFEFYGYRAPFPSGMYLGPIPGWHSGNEKQEVLKTYKFCICFENLIDLKGYVTEKIFNCFAAGCVPIYWGASNIEEYIPKECFIDYRDFDNEEELYQYLKYLSKNKYENYLDNIRCFLQSEKAQLFSTTHYEELLREMMQ